MLFCPSGRNGTRYPRPRLNNNQSSRNTATLIQISQVLTDFIRKPGRNSAGGEDGGGADTGVMREIRARGEAGSIEPTGAGAGGNRDQPPAWNAW